MANTTDNRIACSKLMQWNCAIYKYSSKTQITPSVKTSMHRDKIHPVNMQIYVYVLTNICYIHVHKHAYTSCQEDGTTKSRIWHTSLSSSQNQHTLLWYYLLTHNTAGHSVNETRLCRHCALERQHSREVIISCYGCSGTPWRMRLKSLTLS